MYLEDSVEQPAGNAGAVILYLDDDGIVALVRLDFNGVAGLAGLRRIEGEVGQHPSDIQFVEIKVR